VVGREELAGITQIAILCCSCTTHPGCAVPVQFGKDHLVDCLSLVIVV